VRPALHDLSVVHHQDLVGVTIVLRRCATAIVVRPRISTSSARWISASTSLSTALVASSSRSTSGSAAIAPREGQELPLPHAHRRAALAELVRVAGRQPIDHAVGAHAPGGGPAPVRR
jgi:hypothetical protein